MSAVRLKEEHKVFVVKGFAKFMSLNDIAHEFLIEYDTDCYELCGKKYYSLEEYSEIFAEEYSREREIMDDDRFENLVKEQYKKRILEDSQRLSSFLSAKFRRLNITHPQFPNKYRELFNNTREEYLINYRTENLPTKANILAQLDVLFGYTKNLAFEENDVRQLALAHQILKTIVACKEMDEDDLEIIENSMQALPEPQSETDKQVT